MWHEARKQERMIRGMIVDYRRRAERRKDFYEKIKAEPTQFLQLHGRPCKIHLDPAIAAAGEGPAIMMPWQGDPNNMIDRFDVRAHLDFIPDTKYPFVPPEDLCSEERQCNYERYRILAQNVFLGISEDKFLQQLEIEEQFGVTIEEKEFQKEKLSEKKGSGAAIAYNYNDPGSQPSTSNGPETNKTEQKESDDESDLEMIDVDLSIDVNKMEPSQAHELNAVGPQFGMAGCDLFSFLTGDADDAEHQKQLLREEKEKAMYSGRKSRRERRAHRDKKLASRKMSPPSYAAPSTEPAPAPSRSVSRSPSPDAPENIEFITSFGGEEDETKPSPTLLQKQLYSEKLKQNLKKTESYSEVARKITRTKVNNEKISRPIGPQLPDFGTRSRSRSKARSNSSNSSRSRSRSPHRSWRSRSPRRSSRSRSPRRSSRSLSPVRSDSRSPSDISRYRRRRSGSSIVSDREASKPVPRYYGRRKEDKSSSDISVNSDSSDSDVETNKSSVGNKSNTNQNQLRLSGSGSKAPVRDTMTLKEKLKRKMQAQLSRQLRADKKAEAERVERESRRQARRDEEMRELAIKLRRKQREMRHQQNRLSSDEGSDKSRSGSSSRASPEKEKPIEKEKSRSKSPEPKRIPVWEPNREPPQFHAKPTQDYGESSTQERKRYPEYSETSYYQNERPNYQRYDKREYHRNYNNQYQYDDRGQGRVEGRGYGFRRPFNHRGMSRGGYRYGQNENYGDGPPRFSRNESTDKDNAKNKVKLVDY